MIGGSPHIWAGVSKLARGMPKVPVGYVARNERFPWVTKGPKTDNSVGDKAPKPVGKLIGAGAPVRESSKYEGGQGLSP